METTIVSTTRGSWRANESAAVTCSAPARLPWRVSVPLSLTLLVEPLNAGRAAGVPSPPTHVRGRWRDPCSRAGNSLTGLSLRSSHVAKSQCHQHRFMVVSPVRSPGHRWASCPRSSPAPGRGPESHTAAAAPQPLLDAASLRVEHQRTLVPYSRS
ncbi:hypothetical protein HJG60_011073 [Phyllostomus discolor]|uniref:Uncharacterized protein n=1 Tax=Phyllostomus discolor TaxID=89673 RepID=A0A834ED08_9CHIR|nr:hypothetical protein HJG60_011073 [Phyllostomus discolor]